MTPSICLGKTIDSLTVQQWLSEERALCVKDLHISEYLCLHYYVWEDDKLWRAPDINHIITVFLRLLHCLPSCVVMQLNIYHS